MSVLPVATPARTRQVVRALLAHRRREATAALLTMVAGTAAGLVVQPALGRLVDVVRESGASTGDIVPLVLCVAIASLVCGVLTTSGLALVARLGEGMLAELRERFVDRALRLPLDRVEAAGSGDLTSRVTTDVSVISEAVRQALPELARAAVWIALTLVGLAVLDWRFALAALVAVPVQLWTVRWYTRTAPPVYARQRLANGAQQQELLETIGGAGTVRALRLTGPRMERLSRRSAETVGLTLRGITLMTRFFARLNVAEFLGLSAVLVVGYLLVRDGSASVGTATAAALYFHSLFTPINTALALVDDMLSATASLGRIVGVVDLAGEKRTGAGDPPSAAGASVTVSGVRHSYLAGHEVLRGVDLSIPAGQRVALVGASGAGKTTLASLLAGVRAPTAGTILLGGTPIADLGPDRLRRTVALVTQEVHVFAGPLADDLRLARPGATGEELAAALDRVAALDWARALPEGLETVVGDGGHRLTPAQAQQLALARLVLADPPIAVLDEATAEAGSAGARVLERAADGALRGRTALVVAHRLTQAAQADLVVVMDDGVVVESGPHAALVGAGGPYAALWAAWSAPLQTRVSPP